MDGRRTSYDHKSKTEDIRVVIILYTFILDARWDVGEIRINANVYVCHYYMQE